MVPGSHSAASKDLFQKCFEGLYASPSLLQLPAKQHKFRGMSIHSMPERRCQDSKNRHDRVHAMFAPSILSGFGRNQVIWTEGGVPEACVGLFTCMKTGTMLLAQAHPLGSRDPLRNAGVGVS